MDKVEKLETLVRHLNGAIKSLTLYPPTHPASAQFLARIEEALQALLAEEERVTIGIIEEAFVLDEVPIKASDELFSGFFQRLNAREIGGITFLRGVTGAEIRLFLEALGTDASLIKEAGGMRVVLAERGVRQILVTPIGEEGRPEEAQELSPEMAQAKILYGRALGVVRQIMQEARMGKVPSIEQFPPMVKAMVDEIFERRHALLALTMIKSYDEYLFTHSVNVGILSLALGSFLGLSKEVLFELGLGAFLHDLGKVKWPDEIHRKPRALNDKEWKIVRQHPIDGLKIMEMMGHTNPRALAAIGEHHVMYDKTGYPPLEEEKEPSFLSSIVTIADVYDAMTTVRPYKSAIEPTKALEMMHAKSGKAYDPHLLESFIKMLGIYPVGTLVRLDTGELAIVVKPGEDPTRPKVKLLFDRAGRKVGGEVDLEERDEATGAFKRSILLAVDPASKGIDIGEYL